MDDLDKHARMLAEQRPQLEAAIGRLFTAWATAENGLAAVLDKALVPLRSDVTYAIYFASPGFESRTRIFEVAFDASLAGRNANELLKLCSKIQGSLRRLVTVRNTVAHGTITPIFSTGGNYMAVIPPARDVRRLKMPKQRGQRIGLSAHDIDQSAKAVLEQCRRLAVLEDAMIAFQGDDLPKMHKILAEAETPPVGKDGALDPHELA